MTVLTREQGIAWLRAFGYLGNQEPTDIEYSAAIADMQWLYGLKVDGNLGPVTSRAMSLFRCGMADRPGMALPSGDCKWKKGAILYYHDRIALPGLTADQTAEMLFVTADMWGKVCKLSVDRTPNPRLADVLIGVGQGMGGGFDGPGNVLAWAYMPCNASDSVLKMKFDKDEPWSLDLSKKPGVSALAVAAHEWGHIFGLQHSENSSDLMAPFYNPSIASPQSRDISRVQGLYGPKSPPSQPAPPPAPTPPVAVIPVAGTMKVTGKAVTIELKTN